MILEFVKIGGIWFYWLPNYQGEPEELNMFGAFSFLNSIDDKFVRLQKVNPATARIVLSNVEINEQGARYICKSKFYNGSVWIRPILGEMLGGYPQNLYLSEI